MRRPHPRSRTPAARHARFAWGGAATVASIGLVACSSSAPGAASVDAGRTIDARADGPVADVVNRDAVHEASRALDSAAGADHDATPDGSPCPSSESDPANCGACGHDCHGAACVGGMCQPVILASGQDNPLWIALDATNVYWVSGGPGEPGVTADGSLRSVPIAGGSPVTLASNLEAPSTLVVDSTTVYWVNAGTAATDYADGTVVKMPLAGGAITTLSTSPSRFTGIARDGANVYWADGLSGGGVVVAVPLGGGPAVTLASAQGPVYELVAVSGDVFCEASPANSVAETITKLPVAAGTPVALASNQLYAQGLAVDGSSVYWATEELFVDGGVLDVGQILTVPKAGGLPVTLATQQTSPSALAVDGSSIYWVSYASNGAILKMPLTGGAIVTLASGQSFAQSLAVDDTYIYWSTLDDSTGQPPGTIVRLAK